MPELVWDEVGKRTYETGAHKAALFISKAAGGYETGVAWSGIKSVKQSPDGAEETPLYADNIKYLGLTSAENFKGTIEAFTYPDEFAECDGSAEVATGIFVGQQARKPFGLVYTTVVGNDTMGEAYGEKIHVIYNAKVAPTEKAYETINETPNAITFSWGFSTTPVRVTTEGLRPSAYICFDSTLMTPAGFKKVKDKLYGDSTTGTATLPTMDELITLGKSV